MSEGVLPMEYTKESVKGLLGRRWGRNPERFAGFDRESVDHHELEDGQLVPHLGGLPMHGPSIMLLSVEK